MSSIDPAMSSIDPAEPFPLILFMALRNSVLVHFAQLWSSTEGPRSIFLRSLWKARSSLAKSCLPTAA